MSRRRGPSRRHRVQRGLRGREMDRPGQRRRPYVLASHGEAGIAGLHPDKAGPQRKVEQRMGSAIVGVIDVTFLDFRDGVIEYGLDLRRELTRAIRRYRPEVIVSVNFETRMTGHQTNQADHRAVGLAVLDAARDAGNEWIFEEEELPPWDGVRWVCYTGAPHPTHGVDVTGRPLRQGIGALRSHGQYLDGLSAARPDPSAMLTASTRAGGAALGVPNAVLFDVYPV
jgi:LmbE family N-acetylglucosaminyl deacetylase